MPGGFIFLLSLSGLDDTDLKYLHQALDLAWEGLGRNSPNPLVGCVVVKNSRVVGSGSHIYEKITHAEVIALEEAADNACGATLYVNLEPCCHHGRTPPCTDAIIAAGIGRVVYGIDDPYEQVCGRGARTLATAGVHVERCDDADLVRQIEAQNRFYLHHKRLGRPYITYKAAASLDGRIATREGESKWISHSKALAVAHLLRGIYDAVLIGSRTALTDDPHLTYRPDEVGTAQMPEIIFPHTPVGLKSPLRFVIDTGLKLPTGLNIFDTKLAPTTVICSKDAPSSTVDALTKRGVDIIRSRETENGIDLAAVLKNLAEKGVQSLLIEGGSETAGRFFDPGLVDEVNIIFSPLIIGGRDAVPLISGLGPAKLADAKQIVDMKSQWLGEDLLVVGKISNTHT
jgi:diaminohydroxyphosphoribosylaminopyrimidine deaminase/5-amino-6-(5-phosphoribosylamino)uracil reductase